MNYDVLRTPGLQVSFSTVANPVIPAKYANVTTQGVVSFAIASTIEDVVSRWQQIRPYVPNMSADFVLAEYIIVKHTSGAIEVLGLEWIQEDTIEASSLVTKVVRIANVSSASDNKIAMALARAGFEDVTISNA